MRDDLPGLIKQVEALEDGGTLTLENKTYHLYPFDACTAVYTPCNNDGGEKKIAVLLKGKKGVTVDGCGATLLCHGRLTPFVLDGCTDVTLRNLTIDYTRPFYTQGSISESGPNGAVVTVDKKRFPHRVKDGRLIFYDETWENDVTGTPCLLQEFDPVTRGPARYSLTMFGIFGDDTTIPEGMAAAGVQLRVRLLEESQTFSRIALTADKMPDGYCFQNGKELIICHEGRDNYGVFVQGCAGVHIENVRIVTSGSMGVIAQLTRDITIDGLDVSLGETSKGLVTTVADATHFIHCSGTVTVQNSVMENMMDDGVNIHGIYADCRQTAPNVLHATLKHYQHYGFNPYLPGDTVHILNRSTRDTLACGVVTQSRFTDPARSVIEVTLQQPLEGLPEGIDCLLENKQRMPSVRLIGNRTGHNRPRGFLITTPGRVLVENNRFYNSQFAIHVASDSVYWYESGGVEDMRIAHNRFEDCGFMNDAPVIFICPEYDKQSETPVYAHRNIRVEDNRFETFQPTLVEAHGVDGLHLSGNVCVKTKTYDIPYDAKAPYIINGCAGVLAQPPVYQTKS